MASTSFIGNQSRNIIEEKSAGGDPKNASSKEGKISSKHFAKTRAYANQVKKNKRKLKNQLKGSRKKKKCRGRGFGRRA